jgi:hypothetical protein
MREGTALTICRLDRINQKVMEITGEIHNNRTDGGCQPVAGCLTTPEKMMENNLP